MTPPADAEQLEAIGEAVAAPAPPGVGLEALEQIILMSNVVGRCARFEAWPRPPPFSPRHGRAIARARSPQGVYGEGAGAWGGKRSGAVMESDVAARASIRHSLLYEWERALGGHRRVAASPEDSEDNAVEGAEGAEGAEGGAAAAGGAAEVGGAGAEQADAAPSPHICVLRSCPLYGSSGEAAASLESLLSDALGLQELVDDYLQDLKERLGLDAPLAPADTDISALLPPASTQLQLTHSDVGRPQARTAPPRSRPDRCSQDSSAGRALERGGVATRQRVLARAARPAAGVSRVRLPYRAQDVAGAAVFAVLEGLRGEYHVCSEPASLAELFDLLAAARAWDSVDLKADAAADADSGRRGDGGGGRARPYYCTSKLVAAGYELQWPQLSPAAVPLLEGSASGPARPSPVRGPADGDGGEPPAARAGGAPRGTGPTPAMEPEVPADEREREGAADPAAAGDATEPPQVQPGDESPER